MPFNSFIWALLIRKWQPPSALHTKTTSCDIRVGIHSGDLVAGVVGREKFSYDVWGDTVNTASRLESSGEAGRVNISGATHELVKDFLDCESRGKVSAKNKGEIDMYFVKGTRSIDSANRSQLG